jgi:PKD domain
MRSQRRNRDLLVHLAPLAVAYVLTFQFADSAFAQSIKLAWDASPDTNLAGYRVYRSEQSGSFPASAISGSTLLSTTAFDDSSVQYGHTYYYVVAAVNASGIQSPFSNQVQTVIAQLTTNLPPAVNVGPDQTITLPASATLTASASDDGLPNGTLAYQWSVVSGVDVTLSSLDTDTTTASFLTGGTYTIRVTVSDGELSTSADVNVSVNSAPVPTSTPSLTLFVSKSGVIIKGAMTSISESTTDPRVTKLNLYIDDQLATTVQGTLLTYRWDLRKVSGRHVVTGSSYDSNDAVVVSKSVTVTIK